MKTFGVEYWITEKVDGQKQEPYKDSRTVSAKDAEDAIQKVKEKESKPRSYRDSENNNKLVKVTVEEMEFINVIFRSETDY